MIVYITRNCLNGPIEVRRAADFSWDGREVYVCDQRETLTFRGNDWWKNKKLARQEAQRRRLAKIEELERRCDILRHLWKRDP